MSFNLARFFFFQCSGPDIADPTKHRTDLLTPCSPGAPGAIEMNWMDIEPDRLLEPAVTMQDMMKSLQNSKPSVNDEDLERMTKFTVDFGQEG